MYEKFFGLTEKPFSIQPDPSFLYWGRTHRLAYAMLEYGVLNHAGISVITGEIGCGKTTLVHRLLEQLSDSHTVALISNIQEGRGDLLSWVLMGFGLPIQANSHVEKFAQLQNFFIDEYAKGKRVVMIIDEAQNLSLDMLEELRMLSNINAGKDQLLQLILVGQPQLKGLLNRPELVQLAQRVGSDFHLTPLNKEEVRAYIETRLAIAGCNRRVFTDKAIELIAEQSSGVPRIINIVADTALVYAFSSEELVVSIDIVRNVIRDKKSYGVFGLASDAEAAAPLATPDAGPDAFVKAIAPAPMPDPAPIMTPALNKAVASDTPTPAKEPEKSEPPLITPPPAASPAAPATQKEAASAAASGVSIKTAERPRRRRKSVVSNDAPTLTGVIVVGVDPSKSPEAAIRSAGQDRVVIFVAVGPAAGALSEARRAGAVTVGNPERPFATGGRARNAAYRQLKKIAPHTEFVQYIDSEFALDPDWIGEAEQLMRRRPEVVAVDGARQTSNGADYVGPSLPEQQALGEEGEIIASYDGSLIVRYDAFEKVGGFRGDLPLGETDDLCVRMRRRGGHVWRMPRNMLICDVARNSLTDWWARHFEHGVSEAYAANLYGAPPERLGVSETFANTIWGFAFPVFVAVVAAIAAAFAYASSPALAPLAAMTPIAMGIFVYLLKIIASAYVRGWSRPQSWMQAVGAISGRFPAFLGAVSVWINGGRRRAAA